MTTFINRPLDKELERYNTFTNDELINEAKRLLDSIYHYEKKIIDDLTEKLPITYISEDFINRNTIRSLIAVNLVMEYRINKESDYDDNVIDEMIRRYKLSMTENITLNKPINIKLIKGDITTASTDAIVNAANKELICGGGVDYAIHKAAGPKLQEECNKLNGCNTGNAKITKAYNLNAKYVIHAVGPRYNRNSDKCKDYLYNAYYNSLKLADSYNTESIAFPSISTGIYGYPKEEASIIAFKAIKDYYKNNHNTTHIKYIEFYLYDDETYNIFKEAYEEMNLQ